MQNHLAFHRFQPICDRIMRDRSSKDVDTLYGMVKDAESFYLQNIQQFLLVPLITRMGETSGTRDPSDCKVKIIGVVQLVLEKTELRQVHALKTILIVLAKEVYDFQAAKLLSNLSEELILSVLSCLSVANKRASSDSVEQFFQPENSSQICQIMYVILLLLDNSDSRQIKLTALDALIALLHVDEDSESGDIVLRNQISGIVFFAVPMIWSSLSKLILNDPKIGKQVIERSLITLGRVMCLIMEDDQIIDNSESELKITDFKSLLTLTAHSNSDSQSILNQKEKKRTPEWLRAAGDKLRVPFQSLITLTGSESLAIRKEVGICCEQWMNKCKRSLQGNLDTFTEILLILSEDESESIAQYFSRVLNSLQQQSNHSLVTINRELIERHLSRMSRIIHRKSEKEQLTALTLLKAQLKGLPEEELILLFSNSKSLDVFVMNFLLFIEFNYESPELLKEEHSIRNYVEDEDSSVISLKPWEDFNYFNSKSSKVPLLLQSIMKTIRGKTGNRILIEYLMSILRERPANCAEILKIIQFIVRSSFSCTEDKSTIELLERLLDELLDEKYWNLSFQIIRNFERKNSRAKEQLRVSEHIEGAYESSLVIKYVDLNRENEQVDEYLISPAEAKVNVLVTCVLMETVAAFGHQLGAERFQKYVFRLLFNLLSNAGNSNKCIHSAGLLALTEITKVFQLPGGVRELIMNNSDYVMFFVNKSLRDPNRSQYALDVISVILEFCSKDVVGYVELIVNRLLTECEKYHRMGNLAAYLKIFGLFLKNLNANDEDVIVETNSVDDILQSWLAVLNPKEDEMDFDFETGDKLNEEEEVIPEEIPATKTDPPKNVEIAQQIMQVALKHISSNSQTEVLASMETLTWGVAILRRHEDALLPIVHQIWGPLARRFNYGDNVILRNAFKMLITLADSAKDFIHRRTVDEVVPSLNKILKTSWSVLKTTKEDGGERFTQQFKLVQEIITNYHVVIIRLNIQQKHLDDILSSVIPYLSRTSPKLLSTAAREFFLALQSFNGATVHQKLKSCNQLPVQ